jgi:hypothetical protein
MFAQGRKFTGFVEDDVGSGRNALVRTKGIQIV